VRREGTEALFNTLLVADVCVDIFEKYRVLNGRVPECGVLPVPSGVKSPTVFSETVLPPVFGPVTISRSNVSPREMVIGTTLFAVDQWMATFPDQNASFVIKDRSAGIHGKCQASSSKYEIQFGHDLIVGADLFHIISGIRTKPGKYHLDLFLFFAI